MPVLSNIEAHREPSRTGSRRSFINSVLGLDLLPIATKSKSITDPQQNSTILLQHSPIVGFQYYEGENIWPQMKVGDALTLQREPGNCYDTHTITVYWKYSKLGYIPRRENRTLAQMMDRGQTLNAQIQQLQNEAAPWGRIEVKIYIAGSPSTAHVRLKANPHN